MSDSGFDPLQHNRPVEASGEPPGGPDGSSGAAEVSASEVDALVRLLDDPDADVQSNVRSRLNELGRNALPALREAYDRADGEAREAIDEVVHDLHWRDVKTAWHAVLGADEPSLERAAFVLALYRFPNVDIPAYQDTLDAWAEDVREDVEAASGADRALILTRYMTTVLGFEGNRDDYYDPNNSYVTKVIDRRLGIPISLSVVYLCLARRLGLPVYGVNFPAHFLLKYVDSRGEAYIDLFNAQTTTREECLEFLVRTGIEPDPSYFEAADATSIALRMLRNLRGIAKNAGNESVYDDLTELAEPYEEG